MLITDDLIKEFSQWCFGTQRCTADTVNNYAHTMRQLCLGQDHEEVNTPRFFIRLTNDLSGSGKKLSTISRYVYGVKKFLIFLRDVYGVQIFDINQVKCRRPKYGDPKILEPEEVAKVHALIPKNILEVRDRALFDFLLYTGCRISEAVGLTLEDIDFQKEEAYVIGKGTKPRTVSITNCIGSLKIYLEQRRYKSTYLFLTRTGTHLKRPNAHDAIRDLGRRANLEQEIYPHMLRATFITLMIRAGVDPRTVQKMVGHEELETTLGYYFKVTREGMNTAHQAFKQMVVGF